MTCAGLLFQPTRPVRLLAAQIYDGLDTAAGQPSDLMRRRLRRTPDVIRNAVPVVIDQCEQFRSR